MFDYNTDVALFIAHNGTIDDRDKVREVSPVYVKLIDTNKQIGVIMKRNQNKIVTPVNKSRNSLKNLLSERSSPFPKLYRK
jgi:hypothetical protein